MDIDDDSNEKNFSDESDDEESQAKDLALVGDLEKKISDNCWDYNSHVKLISTLKKLAELDKLRDARNRMNKHFPLSSKLWLDWLRDEMQISTSTEEKENVVHLFERAVNEYLSVDVWLEYAQFGIGFYGENTDTGIDQTRKLFERALAAGGLHVSKGAILWEAYLEYEKILLALAEEEKKDIKIIEAQKKRIANVFRRQLSCPLNDMDDTLDAFHCWLVESLGDLDTKLVDRKMIENTFKTARKKLTDLQKFEQNLAANPEHYEYYSEYLEYEKKEGNPARVMCLYERAIDSIPLLPNLWLEYINYVSEVIHDSATALNIFKRALRNCPFSGRLHVSYIRFLEKNKNTHEEITVATEQALSSGLAEPTDSRDVWFAFLEYGRRRCDAPDLSKEDEKKLLEELRAAFRRASEHLAQMEHSDPDYAVVQFWARIEAKIGDIEEMRQLWNSIVTDAYMQGLAASWLEFINLEAAYGDSKHLRKLFPRALKFVTDWPESIYNVWLNYERDEGSLESYSTCVTKCQARIKEITEQREKEREKNELKEKKFQPRNDNKWKSKRLGLGYQQNEKNSEVKQNINARKRKVEDNIEESSPRKTKKIEDFSNDSSTKNIVDALLNEKSKEHGVSVKHDPSKDNRTVFLSNLDYSVTEENLKEIFVDDGVITEIRLVKDFQGRSKGFCYVVFDKIDSAQKALKRDRQLIGGRPMFVSKCDPDRETRPPGFKFSQRIEKNKLFLKGLPFSTTVEDLKELFAKYGTIKDVRLVTYRNGHSKGLAFVEYEDEVSTKQAIMEKDGSKIGEHVISVAISNPPSRQKTESTRQVASLGGGAKQFGARGKGRTQISFLPRSLQLNSVSTKSLEKLTLNSPKGDSSATSQ